jgi:hypothetical protein
MLKRDIWTYYYTLKSLKLVGAGWTGFYASRFVDEIHLVVLQKYLIEE